MRYIDPLLRQGGEEFIVIILLPYMEDYCSPSKLFYCNFRYIIVLYTIHNGYSTGYKMWQLLILTYHGYQHFNAKAVIPVAYIFDNSKNNGSFNFSLNNIDVISRDFEPFMDDMPTVSKYDFLFNFFLNYGFHCSLALFSLV